VKSKKRGGVLFFDGDNKFISIYVFFTCERKSSRPSAREENIFSSASPGVRVQSAGFIEAFRAYRS
jgi:hypothetical protein